MPEREFDRLDTRKLARLRMAYSREQIRMDERFGVLAAMQANPNRDRKAHPEPYEPADFFPSVPRQGRQLKTQEEMIAALGVVVSGGKSTSIRGAPIG